ncbi:hypothetical protein [Cellulomonas shaoxiangyii]|uniref:Uncharacterized protein n=1 Tax=Cellulomonas shaoxiangyii TaxID=2566013 RepID=A0A4P7SGH3_9CELL|nr:hypothetical protein [Cellulomonas shaoxiangyii]QCB93072.1 hypothetical protein E5225_05390 [Cellulomonas shaoxiangyii]TGY83003.1 hypothetical protein E5226_12715 [Cellulomonas shaoxiangyii]
MPYTPEKPPLPETPEQLRARIPGWGADLDPADRPSVPRERRDLDSGAHWHEPEQQPGGEGRERSIEHARLTPAFGTAQPLHGASGAIRRFAYARYSEARAAHWLLLIAADRVDAVESHLASFATARPDNPVTETGVLSEARRHGLASRRDGKRVDLVHQAFDPVVVAGPWLLAGAAAVLGVRALVRRVR